MMDALKTLVAFVGRNETVLWVIGSLSVLVLIAVVIIIPIIVVRLPDDYFVGGKRTPSSWSGRHPFVRAVTLTGKTAAGLFFLLVGTAMLFLPGQGVLTILIGLTLLNFPGKFKFERKLIGLAPVIRGINWMRKRTRRNALRLD